MGHKHAKLMMMYAEDALKTDKPWELWECNTANDDCGEIWVEFHFHPYWGDSTRYRRKPKKININGYEVPEPVREPLKKCDRYYVADFNGVFEYEWAGDKTDFCRLENGLIHKSQDAAFLHTTALLSFTKIEESKS